MYIIKSNKNKRKLAHVLSTFNVGEKITMRLGVLTEGAVKYKDLLGFFCKFAFFTRQVKVTLSGKEFNWSNIK